MIYIYIYGFLLIKVVKYNCKEVKDMYDMYIIPHFILFVKGVSA